MRILTEKINLDLNQNGIQATIDLREGDIESRLIIATLRGYGNAFRPDDNVIAIIRAKKPDGTIIYNNCLVEDGKIKFLVTSQYAAVEGNYNACIELIKDGVVLYSPKFSFHVAANELSDSEVESSSEYTELTTALEQALTALELAQNLHLLKFVENLEDEGDEKYLYVLTSDYHYIPYVWDAENERYMQLESNLEELREFAYLLSIQKERVDNLLAEAVPGSTTRDLEVIDGRTGYDGRTYANLGTAIREQVNNLHEENISLGDRMIAADDNLNNIKANKSDVNTTTANIEAEIAVERARIDNIASLAEGSTTGDAELTDIRVGADGKTYSSAGDAVRNQIGDLNDNIIPFNKLINLYNGKDFVYGGYSLTIQDYQAFTLDNTHNKITAVIKCLPNTQYWIVRTTSGDNFGRIGTATEYPKANTQVKHIADISGVQAYSITTGADAQYLLFYYTYTGLDELIQITDYEKTTLTQNTYPKLKDSIYTKSEVNALIPQSEIKKCKIRKTSNVIDIYIPSKVSNNFIHFAYELVNSPSINFYQWKVMDTDVCDAALNVLYSLYASSNNVEWEGVVKEDGASDFIGGFHGDETNVSLSVLIDGIELDLTGNLTLTECEEIFIVNKSIINSCNDPTNQLFLRYKVSKWTIDNYTIRNRWIALKNNIKLSTVYMTMFSLPIVKGTYEIATNGRFDDGYIVQDPREAAISGSCLYPSTYAKTVEFFGNDFYGRCKAIYDNYNNYQCICDRSQTNLFKGYWFQHSHGVTMNINDELNGLSEYEFYF